MADSLSFGLVSPSEVSSASCSSYCSLGTRWKESRTGCSAFLSKFIVIDEDLDFFDDDGYEEEPYINEDEEPDIAEDDETQDEE